ncbi:MAG: hypothetical protein K0R80_153 [Clostridia bacterium]|jgi:uncharacterized phiE125 gp8 family phage protein|nr:hypothetical protein [Clostridia bacterium]
MRLDGSESDNNIAKLLRTAREAAESFQNRAYLTQTWELSFDTFPAMPLEMPKPPLQSLVSVKLYNADGAEVSMDITDFIVDTDSEPGRITFKSGKTWPSITLREINAVKFQFKAGYTDASKVPELVKTAILVYADHRYENPDGDDVPEAFYTLLWTNRIVPV